MPLPPEGPRASLRPEIHARHDPLKAPQGLDHVLHATRYGWVVSEFARVGDAAADLGCGTGYGARALAAAGCVVHGVDFDPSVLNLNESGIGRFTCADVTSPRLTEILGRSAFDLVVSMETIEHLEDYVTFLRSCASLVKASGVVVLGTPNRTMTYERYPNRRHMDPSHVQEFTPVALKFAAERFFGSVEIVFQQIPNYWNRTTLDAKTTRTARHGAVRDWVPPILWNSLRRAKSKRVAPQTVALSEKDVQFLRGREGLDLDAFAILAVCRQPLAE